MYINSNSTLNKDTFFKITDYTSDNFVFRNAELQKEISVSKIKEVFVKNLLTSSKTLQILSNLKSMIEAIEMFKQRNITKSI